MTKKPKKLAVYLAGAMEAAPDQGAEWRDDLAKYLCDSGFHVYDPVRLEDKQLQKCRINYLPEQFEHWTELEALPKYWDRVDGYMRKIVDYDCKIVAEKADIVIVYWDYACMQGAGTQGECTLAKWIGVPVYMVTPLKWNKVPKWIRGCVTERFDNFDDLKDFLKKKYKDEEEEK